MELTHHNLHTTPDISFTTSVYGAVPKTTVNSHQAEQGSTAQYSTTPDYGYTGTTGAVPGSSYSYTVDTKGIYESPYRKAATGAGDIVFGTQSSYSSYKPYDVSTQASGSSQPKETIPASYSSHVPNQEATTVPVSYGTGNLYLGESFLNFATSVDGTSNHADYTRLGSIKPWNPTNPSTVEPYTTTIVNHNLDNIIGTPASYITKQASQVSPSGGETGYRPSVYSQQTEFGKRSFVNVQSSPGSATKARGSILAPYRNSTYPEFELVQDLPDRSNLYESMNYLLKQSTERESLLAPPVGVTITRDSVLSPADIKFQRFLKEKYEDGSIYEGESQNGLAHGKGKLIYIDGRSFIGEFSHGKAQGKGVFYFKNGQVWYEGDVFDFVFEGKGVLKCENPVPIQKSVEVEDFGSIGNYWVKYEGEFKGGKKNGNGVLHFTNGDKFTGEFKGDKIHGKGVFEQKDGKVVKGVWEDNKLKQRN